MTDEGRPQETYCFIYNVAASLCEAGRLSEGKEILAKLIARNPDEPQPRYWQAFAQACLSAQTTRGSGARA